jgi:hypothetical protein
MTAVFVKTIVQSWLANGPKPMRVWGKLGMTCPNKAAGGSGAGHRVFGVTVGHADSGGWGLGVVVGNWGIGRKVVAIGAGIGDACVMSRKRRGGMWNKFSQ